jgi:hypothetical protein
MSEEITNGDGTRKEKKAKRVMLREQKKKIKGSNYDDYSGIVNEEGKYIDKPTVGEAMHTMAEYAKNNKMPGTTTLKGTDISSNVYRPKMVHRVVVYDKKKEEAKPKSKIG